MNLFVCMFLMVTQAFAANPGSALKLSDVAEKSVIVNNAPVQSSNDCEVILFFDALDPNAVNYLRMLDSMRFLAADSKREAAFFAIARDSKKILT